jgi:hypothetical protein
MVNTLGNQGHMGNVNDQIEIYVRSSGHMPSTWASTDEVQDAWDLFQSFATRLRNASFSHTLTTGRNSMLTEQELVVGTIVVKSSQPRKRKDVMAKVS